MKRGISPLIAGFFMVAGALLLIAVLAGINVIIAANSENLAIAKTTHFETYMLRNNGTIIFQPNPAQVCNATTNDGALYYNGSVFFACDGGGWDAVATGAATSCDGQTCAINNTGTLDGFNAAQLNDDNPEEGDIDPSEILWADVLDDGTFTDTKYCTYNSSGGRIDCYADAGTGGEPLWQGNSSLVYWHSNPLGFYNSSTLPASSGDNETWNETRADALYEPLGTYSANALSYYNSSTIPTYLTEESDPLWTDNFTNGYNKTAWDEAWGWGDHSTQNYLDTDTQDHDDLGGLTDDDHPHYLNQARFNSNTSGWDTNAADDFDGDYNSLTNQRTHLSNFTDNLGHSEYSAATAAADLQNTSIVRTDTASCSGTDQVDGIYANSSGVFVNCSAQGSGGGMTSWLLSGNGTAGTATITDGETVGFNGSAGITVSRTLQDIVITNELDTCAEITGCVVGALTTESDPLWSGNQSLYYLHSNPLSYYNSSTIPAYLTAESDPLWSNNVTACAAGNHLYFDNGNLACETDDTDDTVSSAELDGVCSTNDRILRRSGDTWACFDDSVYLQSETDPLWSGNESHVFNINTTDNVRALGFFTGDHANLTQDDVASYMLNTTIVRTDTASCSGTDQVDGIYANSSGIFVNCSAQGSGGGMTSWLLSGNGTAGTASITDGETVGLNGTYGISVTRVNQDILIENTLDTCAEITGCVENALTAESDPLWSGNETPVFNINTTNNIRALGFYTNDHTNLTDSDIGAMGYIKSYTETDPLWSNNVTACAAGNHLYFSSGNLACEADATLDGTQLNLTTQFAGEVTGTYGAMVLAHDALDDQYYDSESDLTSLLNDNYADIGNTLNLTTQFAGEVTGTYGVMVLDHDALDDQYYDAEGDLTALLDDNYVDASGDTMTGNLTMANLVNITLGDSAIWNNGSGICIGAC